MAMEVKPTQHTQHRSLKGHTAVRVLLCLQECATSDTLVCDGWWHADPTRRSSCCSAQPQALTVYQAAYPLATEVQTLPCTREASAWSYMSDKNALP